MVRIYKPVGPTENKVETPDREVKDASKKAESKKAEPKKE